MKTPQQIKNEVEKEKKIRLNIPCPICNKSIYLGDEMVHFEKGVYHLNCYKSQILTEYDKSIKEMIEERVNFYEKLWLKAVDEQNKHQEDIFYNTYFNLKELLSKIGDNSEVGK